MTEPEATYPHDFPQVSNTRVTGSYKWTFQASCPICDWKSAHRSPKGLVVLSYYGHLQDSPVCKQTFDKAVALYELAQPHYEGGPR